MRKHKLLLPLIASALLFTSCSINIFPSHSVSSLTTSVNTSTPDISTSTSEPISLTSEDTSTVSSTSIIPESSSTPTPSTSSTKYSHKDGDILVESITFPKESYSVNVGKYIKLVPTVLPAKATNKKLVYLSLDETIATVGQDGKVTGVSAGETSVIAMSTDGNDTICEVKITVNEISVTGITLKEKTKEVKVGDMFSIDYSLIPSNASNKEITYVIADESIVTINESNILTALKAGSTIITLLTSNPEVKASINVKVNDIIFKGFVFKDSELSINVNDGCYLTSYTFPRSASFVPISYTVDNPSIVKVDTDGYILGLKQGKTTVRASVMEGKFSDTIEITVTDVQTFNKTQIERTYMDYYSNNVYGFDSAPTLGDINFLVVPIWFNDSSTFIKPEKKSNVRNDIYSCMFGTNNEVGWRSVNTFYKEESFDHVNIKGVVTDWYEENESYKTYGNSLGNLVEKITSWLKTIYTVDEMSQFDADANGLVDGLIFIYAAPTYDVLGTNQSNLWAYRALSGGVRPGKDGDYPNISSYLWASYCFMYSSDYGWNQGNATERTGYNYGKGNCRGDIKIDSITFIHEVGHMLGADDYYDYSGQYSPAGGFSMQDYNCGTHDPFTEMAYGWVNPYVITEETEITIRPFIESGDVVLLSPNFNSINSPFDEYILIELFSNKGINSQNTNYPQNGRPTIKKDGIRIWHVDARLLYTNGTSVSPNNYTVDPLTDKGKVLHMFTNTYYGSSEDASRITILGSKYADYNILQMIRNYPGVTYKCSSMCSENDLYQTNSTFSMSAVKDQFVNKGLLNSGLPLGFKVKFTSVTSQSATLKITYDD